MTHLTVRQALSKRTMALGMVVFSTIMLSMSKVSAHTNHSHTPEMEQSAPENSDGEETAVTAPVKQDTDAQNQEVHSSSPTPPVTTAEVLAIASVPLGEILLGLVVAVPPLLISFRKRIQ